MKTRYWLGIAISALLLVFLLRSVDLPSVGLAIRDASPVFLLPALALYFTGVAVRTLRWGVLLSPVRKLSFSRLFVVMVAGFMANDILPFRAGEGVRAFMLWSKERVEPGTVVGTIVVERIFDGLVLTGFLLLAGLILPLGNWVVVAWIAGIVFAGGSLVVLVLTIAPGPFLRLAELLLSVFPPSFRNLGLRVLRTFVQGLGILRSGRDTLTVAALSLLAWGLEAGMYYLLMFSFPFPPRYLAAILGAAVANLGTMVPSSPGYVGTFDAPLVNVLTETFRVEPSLAAGYTILVHAALVVPVTLLGLYFVWREGLTLSGITSSHRPEQAEGEDPDTQANMTPRRFLP